MFANERQVQRECRSRSLHGFVSVFSTHWTAAFHIRVYLSLGSGHQHHVKLPPAHWSYHHHIAQTEPIKRTRNWKSNYMRHTITGTLLQPPCQPNYYTLMWSQKQFIDPFMWPTFGDRIFISDRFYYISALLSPQLSLKMGMILLYTLWKPNYYFMWSTCNLLKQIVKELLTLVAIDWLYHWTFLWRSPPIDPSVVARRRLTSLQWTLNSNTCLELCGGFSQCQAIVSMPRPWVRSPW